jgi:hypothetical protein
VGTIVKLSPEQIVPLLTAMVGDENTVTVAVAVLDATHPAELVPVME